MIFPFDSLVANNYEFGLIVSVLIGFGFGFSLERAGFGRATKLAGQFYLNDMTVFKVMFSAIVTAMLGIMVLHGLGLADLKTISESVVSATFIWPMLVGGFLLGVGFIVSGYCPGTSLASAASGHLDGIVTFVGVIVGTLVFGELYPLLESFNNSGAVGQLFLYDVLGIPAPALAFIVTIVAVAAFIGAEKVEKIVSKKRGLVQEETTPPLHRKRFSFGALSLMAVLALALMTVPKVPAALPQAEIGMIQAKDLAQVIFDEPWNYRIIDTRSTEACAKSRIPGSECVPSDKVKDMGLAYAPVKKKLILVSNNGSKELPQGAGDYKGEIKMLGGGFAAWKNFALSKPEPPGPEANAELLDTFRFRSAVHAAMTGAKPTAAPIRPLKGFVPPKKKKGGGCN